MVAAVATTGSVAWLSVAWASKSSEGLTDYLGLAALSLALASAELSYLVWHNWTHGERGLGAAAVAGASGGSALVLTATVGGVSAPSFVAIASGVGLLGLATAAGLSGLYRITGKSTPATLTAMIIVAALAYFASVLWGAVP
jgi:hypothetical protein